MDISENLCKLVINILLCFIVCTFYTEAIWFAQKFLILKLDGVKNCFKILISTGGFKSFEVKSNVCPNKPEWTQMRCF